MNCGNEARDIFARKEDDGVHMGGEGLGDLNTKKDERKIRDHMVGGWYEFFSRFCVLWDSEKQTIWAVCGLEMFKITDKHRPKHLFK